MFILAESEESLRFSYSLALALALRLAFFFIILYFGRNVYKQHFSQVWSFWYDGVQVIQMYNKLLKKVKEVGKIYKFS